MLGCKGLMGTGKFPGKSDGMLGAGGVGGVGEVTMRCTGIPTRRDKMMLK